MHGRVSAIFDWELSLRRVLQWFTGIPDFCEDCATVPQQNLLANLGEALCRLCELPKSDTRKEPLCIYFAEPGGDSQGRWNFVWQTITSST